MSMSLSGRWSLRATEPNKAARLTPCACKSASRARRRAMIASRSTLDVYQKTTFKDPSLFANLSRRGNPGFRGRAEKVLIFDASLSFLPAAARFRLLPLPPAQEHELLKQAPVLLALEQRAVQRLDQLLGLALAQRLGGHVLVEQELQPV